MHVLLFLTLQSIAALRGSAVRSQTHSMIAGLLKYSSSSSRRPRAGGPISQLAAVWALLLSSKDAFALGRAPDGSRLQLHSPAQQQHCWWWLPPHVPAQLLAVLGARNPRLCLCEGNCMCCIGVHTPRYKQQQLQILTLLWVFLHG